MTIQLMATDRPHHHHNFSFEAVLFDSQYSSSFTNAMKFGAVQKFNWSSIEPTLTVWSNRMFEHTITLCWSNLTVGDYRVRVVNHDRSDFWNHETSDLDDTVFDNDCLKVTSNNDENHPASGFNYFMAYHGTNATYDSPRVSFWIHENNTLTQAVNVWVRNSYHKTQSCRIFSTSPVCNSGDDIRWLNGPNYQFVSLPALTPGNNYLDYIFGAISNAPSSTPDQSGYMTIYSSTIQDVSQWYKNKISNGRSMIHSAILKSLNYKATNKQLNNLSKVGRIAFYTSSHHSQYNSGNDDDVWSYL
jgi:hypothetical protein